MIPPNPYGAPGPSAPIDWSGMNSNLPMQGLGSLFQGLNQGIDTGANLALKIRGQNLESDKLQNEMDWRKQQANQLNQYRQGEIQNRSDALKQQGEYQKGELAFRNMMARIAQQNADTRQAKGGGAAEQTKVNNALGAYESLNNLRDSGKDTLSATPLRAAASSIPQGVAAMFPNLFATSPINKYEDRLTSAGQWTLSALPHSRYSEQAVDKEKQTLGGRGEDVDTLNKKIELKRNEIAASLGKSPEELDDMLAGAKTHGWALPKGPNWRQDGGIPSAFAKVPGLSQAPGAKPSSVHDFGNGMQAHLVNGKWTSSDGSQVWDGKSWQANNP